MLRTLLLVALASAAPAPEAEADPQLLYSTVHHGVHGVVPSVYHGVPSAYHHGVQHVVPATYAVKPVVPATTHVATPVIHHPLAYGYPYGVHGIHGLGKREAEAEPEAEAEAEADPYLIYGGYHGLGAYNGLGAYGAYNGLGAYGAYNPYYTYPGVKPVEAAEKAAETVETAEKAVVPKATYPLYYPGFRYGSYGFPSIYGHHGAYYGKRSADAEPKATPGYPYIYGHGNGAYYGKRSAEAEPEATPEAAAEAEADPWFAYSGYHGSPYGYRSYGHGHHGYSGYRGYSGYPGYGHYGYYGR